MSIPHMFFWDVVIGAAFVISILLEEICGLEPEESIDVYLVILVAWPILVVWIIIEKLNEK